MERSQSDKSQNQGQKAVIYLRVSTEEQVSNYSLETQKDICTKEVERRELELDQIFSEEGRSAKTIHERKTLIEMLEYCRKHKKEIRAVIVYRIDRISRQTEDYLAIRKKLAESGIALISATEPTGNTPAEKFIETMLAGFAQMDNDVRGERTKNGMRARFLSGLHNGNVPLGYLNQDGYAVKHPERFVVMKEMWELVATGTKSLQDIADILEAKGIREQRKGHAETKIRQQTLSRIFRNKFYAGKLVSPKYGEEIQGQQPAMITEELFYKVQSIIDGRNRNIKVSLNRRNPNNPAFPLRRIVKCSRCGTSFTGGWSKGKRERYGYYFCRIRCSGGSSVPAAEIHSETDQKLKNSTAKPQTIELFIAFLRRTYFLRMASLNKRREQSDESLKKLYELRQALVEKNLKGIYSDDIFREQNKILEEKIKMIQYTKNEEAIEQYNIEKIIVFVKAKFADLSESYAVATYDQGRTLLCSIFPSGLQWSYPGYSNTVFSPFYQAILAIENSQDNFGAPGGARTPDL